MNRLWGWNRWNPARRSKGFDAVHWADAFVWDSWFGIVRKKSREQWLGLYMPTSLVKSSKTIIWILGAGKFERSDSVKRVLPHITAIMLQELLVSPGNWGNSKSAKKWTWWVQEFTEYLQYFWVWPWLVVTSQVVLVVEVVVLLVFFFFFFNSGRYRRCRHVI